MDQINADVTPSLHPSVIEAVDGYEQHMAFVVEARNTFDETYKTLAAIHDARRAVADDPTMTDTAKLLAMGDFAEKQSEKLFRKFDGAVARLTLAVRDHESKLTAPVQQAAAAPVAAEIRAHVKAMKQGERASFMNDALKAGDTQTITAVLGAPSYLSGLTEVEKQVHTRAYHSKANPDLSARLAIMTKAKELLEQRGPLVHGELERAIGGSWAKVSAARQAANKSKAAFALPQQ
ncbi:hypothetical protein [Cupriavidus pauculus]|uniref:Uncharacterized protein n=1 Tax=Cupriavidus pauculus TaxID=82633 RepID=A0A2N5C953_9BURK|nr:hypothetical protein [Cupriavidus pauculus]PLP98742.1 hypothetical protein CYJ10_20830 [Cupriavidus pauculus]